MQPCGMCGKPAETVASNWQGSGRPMHGCYPCLNAWSDAQPNTITEPAAGYSGCRLSPAELARLDQLKARISDRVQGEGE